MIELLAGNDKPGWDERLDRDLAAAPDHDARIAVAMRYVGDEDWAERLVAHFEGTFESDRVILPADDETARAG